MALRTSSPGSGGTNTSGSNRVASTWAASLTSAGQHARRPTRNTSLSNRAPSWRARTWDTTPEMRRSWPSGSSALERHDVVELEVGPSATPTQNSSGVASSVPMTRPTTGDTACDVAGDAPIVGVCVSPASMLSDVSEGV